MQDVPIIDDIGYTSQTGSGGGGVWIAATSSTGDPIKRRCCRQLSVIHGIRWNIVIYIDVLGPQSYTLKSTTARAAAGRSLAATSR